MQLHENNISLSNGWHFPSVIRKVIISSYSLFSLFTSRNLRQSITYLPPMSRASKRLCLSPRLQIRCRGFLPHLSFIEISMLCLFRDSMLSYRTAKCAVVVERWCSVFILCNYSDYIAVVSHLLQKEFQDYFVEEFFENVFIQVNLQSDDFVLLLVIRFKMFIDVTFC
ncbi:unnamed protein product [Tenebrio molitor]|nr:unnamed protein product [Tenebrio molitor]